MCRVAIKKFAFPNLSGSEEVIRHETNFIPEPEPNNIVNPIANITTNITPPETKIIPEHNISKIKEEAFKQGYSEAKEFYTKQQEEDNDISILFENINNNLNDIRTTFDKKCKDLSQDIIKTISIVISKINSNDDKVLLKEDIENFIRGNIAKLRNCKDITVFINNANFKNIEKSFSQSQSNIHNKIQLQIDEKLDITNCRIEHRFGFLEMDKKGLIDKIQQILQDSLDKKTITTNDLQGKK